MRAFVALCIEFDRLPVVTVQDGLLDGPTLFDLGVHCNGAELADGGDERVLMRGG